MEREECEMAIGRLVLLKEITTTNYHKDIDIIINNLVEECMGYEG